MEWAQQPLCQNEDVCWVAVLCLWLSAVAAASHSALEVMTSAPHFPLVLLT